MSNEQSKVVTKVIDVRHKAPDQAIHELMQAAKDGFAVTKIATRFNHTHIYLEASSKQVSASNAAGEASSKQVSKVETTGESYKAEEKVEKAEVKAETVKPVAKKTATKTTPKKEEPKASE